MAILTVIFGVLGSISAAIGAVLKAIPPTVWLCLVCVIIGMVIVSKGCSCERPRLFPLREPRVINHISEVKEVMNGASIKVLDGFLQRRIKIVWLTGVYAPVASSPYAVASKDNLEKCAGRFIWVKSDSVMVYGESGICLQLVQLNSGFARCQPGAPKEFLQAEAYAKKMKLGIWDIKP